MVEYKNTNLKIFIFVIILMVIVGTVKHFIEKEQREKEIGEAALTSLEIHQKHHFILNTMVKNPNSPKYNSIYGASHIGLNGRYFVIKTYREDLNNSIQSAANDIIDARFKKEKNKVDFDLTSQQKKIFEFNLGVRKELDDEIKRIEGIFAKDKIKPEDAMKTGKKLWETIVPDADITDLNIVGEKK